LGEGQEKTYRYHVGIASVSRLETQPTQMVNILTIFFTIMATKIQKAARVGLFADLKDLQDGMREVWADLSIPDDWNYLEGQFPTDTKKIKVSLYLDEDMVRWFRKLGKGYQARINAILRIYWRGLISGDVRSYTEEHEVSPRKVAYLAGMRAQLEDRMDMAVKKGLLDVTAADQVKRATAEMWGPEWAQKEVLRRVMKERARRG
jgi:hypothetical protein